MRVWHASRVARQYGETALMSAAANGDADVVQQLLEHGADANRVDSVSAVMANLHCQL